MCSFCTTSVSTIVSWSIVFRSCYVRISYFRNSMNPNSVFKILDISYNTFCYKKCKFRFDIEFLWKPLNCPHYSNWPWQPVSKFLIFFSFWHFIILSISFFDQLSPPVKDSMHIRNMLEIPMTHNSFFHFVLNKKNNNSYKVF